MGISNLKQKKKKKSPSNSTNCSQFQLQQTILIFCNKFTKGYFWLKTKINEHHH